MVDLIDMVGETFGIFSQEATSIEGLVGVIDIYPEESHSISVTKTTYPVEKGSNGTDNAVIEPKKLVLEGWVSNLQPLLGGLVSIPGPGRPKEAWSRIVQLVEGLGPVTVVTLLATYENMLAASVDATLNSDTGTALRFIIVLEEVSIGQTEIATLPQSQLSGPAENKPSETDGGLKQSEQSDSSLLKVIADKTANFFN